MIKIRIEAETESKFVYNDLILRGDGFFFKYEEGW